MKKLNLKTKILKVISALASVTVAVTLLIVLTGCDKETTTTTDNNDEIVNDDGPIVEGDGGEVEDDETITTDDADTVSLTGSAILDSHWADMKGVWAVSKKYNYFMQFSTNKKGKATISYGAFNSGYGRNSTISKISEEDLIVKVTVKIPKSTGMDSYSAYKAVIYLDFTDYEETGKIKIKTKEFDNKWQNFKLCGSTIEKAEKNR